LDFTYLLDLGCTTFGAGEREAGVLFKFFFVLGPKTGVGNNLMGCVQTKLEWLMGVCVQLMWGQTRKRFQKEGRQTNTNAL
jgi:hypothetical protein